MPNKYQVLKDREIAGTLYAKAGDVVYECINYDYGCAGDDTRGLGYEHISVTKDAAGGYPFFTIPTRDLKPVSAP
jgi:hypothetical protein